MIGVRGQRNGREHTPDIAASRAGRDLTGHPRVESENQAALEKLIAALEKHMDVRFNAADQKSDARFETLEKKSDAQFNALLSAYLGIPRAGRTHQHARDRRAE